ncbi:helix-turn-helix transcriptional regulator [Hydrogenophaga sp.]|uniref:helix-turn-helix transcriptional regulator n=1 Tax=Hydrogenophaga sp. TaxID=1904254 RepID=UPI0026236673|nr:helix-turn-helix transcriptional regulator [Hydrogenophaga sp.]MCW5654906.1 helix-turn-helix transcriptional regulator [Hydrogenophaga sp.]
MKRRLTEPQELSALLLKLYRLSHELPLADFQDATLDLVREALPFDSSMWGTATQTGQGIDIHTIHLHNQSPQMLADYEAVKHLDTAARAVGERPRNAMGFDAREWFHLPEQAPLLDYGRRHEQAHFFIASDFDPSTRFVHWISLFRAGEKARCTPQENQLLALLAPHVMQALTLNRLAHMDRLETAATTDGRAHAICDPRGVLYHADAGFEALLAGEWHGWRGRQLPEAPLRAFQRGETLYRGATVVISQRAEQGLLFLRARMRCRVDDLTPRERTVAELVAGGRTYKAIAQHLGRSPATVRNQIRSIYDKLGVSHIAGLIDALRCAS